ncbi:MAG: DUF6046 domain-containing protein, partial [Alistipes sp.]|nr:DUF6046 domain-containing protein [Alistipes sp.]
MTDEENNRYYAEGSITDAGERAPVREPEGWLDPGMYAPSAIGEAERWLDASSHLPPGVRKEEMSLDPKDYHVRSARGHLPFIGGVNSLSDTPYVLGYNFMQRHKKGVTPMRLKLKSEKGDTVMNKTKKDGSVRTNREGETNTKVISTGDWFEFEIEPTVSVEGKNTIISRKVLRSGIRGTVKERWSHDDYSITITGLLINKNRLLK